MGYIRNHVIVVTDHGHGDCIQVAHEFAMSLGGSVTEITDETTNGVQSFALMPDGSKEGWDESQEGDTRRDRLVTFLRTLCYEDGSSPLSWVEVQFGDDENVAKIIQSSDDDQKERRTRSGQRPPDQTTKENDNGNS